jgi:hypothetical protein
MLTFLFCFLPLFSFSVHFATVTIHLSICGSFGLLKGNGERMLAGWGWVRVRESSEQRDRRALSSCRLYSFGCLTFWMLEFLFILHKAWMAGGRGSFTRGRRGLLAERTGGQVSGRCGAGRLDCLGFVRCVCVLEHQSWNNYFCGSDRPWPPRWCLLDQGRAPHEGRRGGEKG